MIENFMWMPYPYVRYVFYLILGILVSNYIGGAAIFKVLFYAAIVLYVIIFPGRNYFAPTLRSTIPGGLGFLIVFSLGAIRLYQHDDRNRPGHLINLGEPVSHYTAKVISEISHRRSYSKVSIFIDAVKTKKGWKSTRAKALLYIKHDSLPYPLDYGDKIFLTGSAREVKGPSNPHAFNYKNFLARQNIFHQHYTDTTAIIRYAGPASYNILYRASKVRRKMVDIIAFAIRDQRERSVVLSLLLGEREGLDPQVKKVYSDVGAMHVLAVSGLHVGIVYLLFSLVLGIFKNHKTGKWFFLAFCLAALWFYALLTGLSTSVLRAVMMFTFILLGDTINRRSNTYNNIALAAFVLLLIDPFHLFQVGFQLSFAAVTGIVYLQPKIASWLHFNNIVLKKVWDLTAVSLAAQAATFPISIYYFHQFPTYFWLTNLLIIPSATLIIFLGIFVLALGSFDISGAFFSTLLEKLVFFTNEGLVLITALPLASIRDLYLTAWDVLLIYAGTVVLTIFPGTLKIRHLCFSLFLFFLLSTRLSLHYFNTVRQRQIVFYDISRTCAIDFINGRKQNLLVISKNREIPVSALRFAITNYRIAHGLSTRDVADPKASFDRSHIGDGKFRFFHWNGLVFLALNGKLRFREDYNKKVKINYLLINNNAVEDFEQLRTHFEFDKVIITNLNSFKYASKLYNYCLQHQVETYSVMHNGALIEEVKVVTGKNNLD